MCEKFCNRRINMCTHTLCLSLAWISSGDNQLCRTHVHIYPIFFCFSLLMLYSCVYWRIENIEVKRRDSDDGVKKKSEFKSHLFVYSIPIFWNIGDCERIWRNTICTWYTSVAVFLLAQHQNNINMYTQPFMLLRIMRANRSTDPSTDQPTILFNRRLLIHYLDSCRN